MPINWLKGLKRYRQEISLNFFKPLSELLKIELVQWVKHRAESNTVQKAPRGLSNWCAKAHQALFPRLSPPALTNITLYVTWDKAYPCSYAPSLIRCWNMTAACLDKQHLCGSLLMNSLAWLALGKSQLKLWKSYSSLLVAHLETLQRLLSSIQCSVLYQAPLVFSCWALPKLPVSFQSPASSGTASSSSDIHL